MNTNRALLKTSSTARNASDREFVATAAPDGAAEVALGRLAASKTGDAKIREFANRMIEDHSWVCAELRRIAESKGIKVSDAPTAEQQAARRRLESLEGESFDHEYARLAREDHDRAIEVFSRESRSGVEPALKEFAARTLPKLEMHRKMAQELAAVDRPQG